MRKPLAPPGQRDVAYQCVAHAQAQSLRPQCGRQDEWGHVHLKDEVRRAGIFEPHFAGIRDRPAVAGFIT